MSVFRQFKVCIGAAAVQKWAVLGRSARQLAGDYRQFWASWPAVATGEYYLKCNTFISLSKNNDFVTLFTYFIFGIGNLHIC